MGDNDVIREVWASNLLEEMEHIRQVVTQYPYVAMDTEFPGVVAKPVGKFKNTGDLYYQTLRCNVDLLKIIQLGITFSDENGKLPPGVCTWQFNFQFDVSKDMYAADSIEMLTKSGVNWPKHNEQGIDATLFGELLMTSGLVLNDAVRWITFHSIYDFGYLVKLLTCDSLPGEEHDFSELLHMYFPCYYDIKYLMKLSKNLKGGLQDLADILKVERIGPQHQAGSDSLLTSMTFFKMRHLFFDDKIDDSRCLGVLFGLGVGGFSTNSAQNPLWIDPELS